MLTSEVVLELRVTEATRTSVCAFVFVAFEVRRLYAVQLTPSLLTSTVNTPLPDVIPVAKNCSDALPFVVIGIPVEVVVADTPLMSVLASGSGIVIKLVNYLHIFTP